MSSGSGPAQPPPATEPITTARRWVPVVAVVAMMAVVTGGGFAVAGTLGPVTTETVTVSRGVTLPLRPGWETVSRSEDPRGVVTANGVGSLAAYAVTASDPTALINNYADEVIEPQATQIQFGTLEPRALPSGHRAVRIPYQGTFPAAAVPLEGELTALVAPGGTGVLFDAVAAQGQFVMVQEEIESMIEGAEVA